MKDYYRILEVEPISTHEVIKTNFRRLAKVYHPDISKSNFTADKFIEITEAYEVLSDATKRDKYNFYYNNAQNNQQDNESVFQEWENFGRQKAAEYAKCWVCGDNSNPEHSWFVSMQKDDEYTYVLLPHCTKCNKQLEKEQTRNKYLFIIFYFITYIITVKIFYKYENPIGLSIFLGIFVVAIGYSIFNRFVIIFSIAAYLYVFYNIHWLLCLVSGFILTLATILIIDNLNFNRKKPSIRLKNTANYKPIGDLIKNGWKIKRVAEF